MQIFLHQLRDSMTSDCGHSKQSSTELSILRAKIKSLEKDLYYYKKTSRDLKQQIQRQHEKKVTGYSKDTGGMQSVGLKYSAVGKNEDTVHGDENEEVFDHDSLDDQ